MVFLLVFGGKLAEAGEAAPVPAKFEAPLLARDHLRADKGLERAGDDSGERLRVDLHSLDDGAWLMSETGCLFVDDLDELGLD